MKKFLEIDFKGFPKADIIVIKVVKMSYSNDWDL